jgi:beta-phosphoglucomutase
MNSSVKAVIFDCDGTLVDSEHSHYLAWKRALSHFGSGLTVEEYPNYVGRSAEKIAVILAERTGQKCAERLLAMKNDYYEELCQAGLPAIDATVTLLKSLAAQKESLGIKIGICSAARKSEIVSHLRGLNIEHVVDIVLSGQEDLGEYVDPEGVNKPKPYIYLHVMKQLGLLPENIVVIEDSTAGVLASRAAGCFTIAVPNDYTRHHDLSSAHIKIASFADLSIDAFLKLIQPKEE